MSNEQSNDKIINRVRKMINLANDAGATEGERDNAMRMAHALLAKHNLSLGDVETEEEKRLIEADEEIGPHAWARTAAVAIARLYFCEYFFVRTRGSQKIKHNFVGRASNVATAREIAVYVVKSISKEARRAAKVAGQGGTYERDFCKAAASAVWIRCVEMRRQAEEASRQSPTATATGTALVLASVYEQENEKNLALLAAEGLRLKSQNDRQSRTSTDGASHGLAFGNNINLGRQVGNSKQPAAKRIAA